MQSNAALLPHLPEDSDIAPITARIACYSIEHHKRCLHGVPARGDEAPVVVVEDRTQKTQT